MIVNVVSVKTDEIQDYLMNMVNIKIGARLGCPNAEGQGLMASLVAH